MEFTVLQRNNGYTVQERNQKLLYTVKKKDFRAEMELCWIQISIISIPLHRWATKRSLYSLSSSMM